MSRTPHRHAARPGLLLALLLIAAAAPASADYYDHQGTFALGGGWVPGESVTGSHADSGFGFNVGVGLDFQIDHGTSLFVDARYHHAYMPGVDMDLIPISFGFRW
jgi:hypothetical protein